MDVGILRQILIGLVCEYIYQHSNLRVLIHGLRGGLIVSGLLSGNLLIVDSGFHEGWSTPMLPKLDGEDPYVKVNPEEGAWIVNLMYVGVAVGSIAPLFLMDKIGRKWTMIVAAFPKLISWALLALGQSVEALYLGRFLAGIGCGISYSVTPMYIGEITSKRTRGPLSAMMAVLINIGMLSIYAIGLWCTRPTTAYIAVTVLVVFLLTFIWLPESSVYLTKKNRLASAERTLKWSLAKDNVDEELEEIKRIVAVEECSKATHSFWGSMSDMLFSRHSRRAFGIGLILLSALTFTGAAPILAYQSFIFEEAGVDVPVNICIVVTGLSIVLSGAVCVAIVRCTGKRTLLLISAPLCVISLTVLATFFTLLSYNVDMGAYKWIPTVFSVTYVVSYGLALNPIPLAYIGEIFPFEAKVPAAIFSSLYYALATTTAVKIYQVIIVLICRLSLPYCIM